MKRLAYALAAVGVLTAVAGAAVTTPLEWEGPADLVFGTMFALLGTASAVTGALVASRVPRNAVGWIILGLGLGVGLSMTTNAYAVAATSWPGREAAAWLSDILGIAVLFGLTGFLLLLFPTGGLPTPRWRAFAWFFALVVGCASISNGLNPGEIVGGIDNPIALSGTAARVNEKIVEVTDVLGLPAMIGCAVALVVRFRRSRGLQRQQLKWFTSAATMAGVGLGVTVTNGGTLSELAFFLGMLGLILLPVTAGIAILRHNLFDIDLVIKRTLVYGVLTAILALTYLVCVLGFRFALDPLTGGSDLAVAASTLAVAALFRPLRSGIQRLVDRRFFRQQFDAARTLEDFSGRLREDIDLDSLGADLRTVVRDTMQPAHVTLWLRSQP